MARTTAYLLEISAAVSSFQALRKAFWCGFMLTSAVISAEIICAESAEIICGWTRACVSSEEGLGGRARGGGLRPARRRGSNAVS